MTPSEATRLIRTVALSSELSADLPADELPDVGEVSDRFPAGADGWLRPAGAALGGTLLVIGIRRGGIVGTVAATAGGWLLYRSLADPEGLSGAFEGARASLADRVGSDRGVPDDGVTIERSVTVGEPAEDLYELWRDPERLAEIAGPVVEVSAVDADDGSDATGLESETSGTDGSAGETEESGPEAAPDRLRFAAEGPLDRRLAWEMELVEERPAELLRWESIADAPVAAEMAVRFEPAAADRGTTVTLEASLDPPGGDLGTAGVGALAVVPETLARKVLYRFKSLAETGEIPTLETNPSGRGQGGLI